MKPHQRAIYAWLIARFPAEYRARVGESMLDTFEDALRDAPHAALGLYADACLHLLKETMMQTKLHLVIVATAGLLCGFVPRALNLQVPGSVYLVWGAIALLIGAVQKDVRAVLVSAGLFGLLLALSLLVPGIASSPDARGYAVMLALASMGAIAASLLAAGAGFWVRGRFTS